MAQPRTDGSSEGHSDTLHEDTYLHSTEASATLDSSNSTKFRPYSQLLAALLFILLYVYITLIALMVTGYLDHRTFDIDNIGLVSTFIVVISQTFATLITAAMGYLGQSLGFQYLIYRNPGQTLASLHYSLSAFSGMLSASKALWGARHLKGGRQYILQLLLYAIAMWALQTFTTTIVSVETVMANTTISVDVTKLFDDGSATPFDFNQTSARQSMGGLPLVWGNISIGLQLSGLNGSVFFSYPTKLSDANDVYLDHDARRLSTHCETFPFGDSDDLSIGYLNLGSATEIQQYEVLIFLVEAKIRSLPFPNATYMTPWFIDVYSMNPPRRQFGGEKSTKTSPPVINFQGVLPLQELDTPPLNLNATAFLYINTNPNALQVNPSLNVSAPMRRDKQPSVWSWLPEDTVNITSMSQEIPNAFLETANMSFYVWPMFCTMSVLNVTAQVNGNGQLLSYWENEGDDAAPVGPAFSTNWATMLNTITTAEFFVHLPADIRAFWFEDQIVSALNTSLSGAPNTTLGAITTLEARLNILSALGYALFSRTPAYENTLNVTSASTDPRSKTVTGVRSILRARLSINALQLYIAFASTLVIATFLGILINSCRLQLKGTRHDRPRGGRIDLTGAGAVEVIALMDGSDLPRLLHKFKGELLKERAQNISVQMEFYDPAAASDTDSQDTAIPTQPMCLAGKEINPGPLITHIPKRKPLSGLSWTLPLSTLGLLTHTPKRKLPSGLFWTLITLGLLISFHVALVILYVRDFFNTQLFSLSHIRIISQAVTLGSQLVCIALMIPFQSALQKVAQDMTVRKDQRLVDLSDTLLAWSGFWAAIVASIRNFRSRGFTLALATLAMVTTFNVAVTLLNISMPALLSVSTVSANRQTTTLAQPMPGNFFTSASWTATGDVNEGIASLQYMAGYFNGTVGTVQGWNETVFHSIPANNSASNTFRDGYASQLVAKCRYLQPPEANATFQVTNSDSTLVASAHIAHALPPNLTQTFNLTTVPNGRPYNYTFGGSKPSQNSPPNIHFPDMVMLDAGGGSSCSEECMAFGNIAVGYLTLRPSGLAPPEGVEFPPPMTSTLRTTVVSWVGNAVEDKFNEPVDLTFYLYPLICSPYLLNTTAYILGNGTMLSYDPPPQPSRSQTPFDRGIPTMAVERNWPHIVASLISNPLFISTNVMEWFEETWQTIVSRNATVEAIEHELAFITSMVYAIAVLNWKDQLDGGNPLVLSYWAPSNVTIEGYSPEIVGTLEVNVPMLIVGCVCSGVLLIIAGIHMKGLCLPNEEEHDGSVLDLISILYDSDLPSLMGMAGVTRRQQAAMIQVEYEDGKRRLGGSLVEIPLQSLGSRQRSSDAASTDNVRGPIATAPAPGSPDDEDDEDDESSEGPPSNVPPTGLFWRPNRPSYRHVPPQDDGNNDAEERP